MLTNEIVKYYSANNNLFFGWVLNSYDWTFLGQLGSMHMKLYIKDDWAILHVQHSTNARIDHIQLEIETIRNRNYINSCTSDRHKNKWYIMNIVMFKGYFI
jgi:hypothetical protein